jgi:hypothetical protein
LRERPTSSFNSVADLLHLLIQLPSDLSVPKIILEARRL